MVEVVDAKCKVIGLQGLRVADGSVIPEAVSGVRIYGNLRGRDPRNPQENSRPKIKGLLTYGPYFFGPAISWG